MSTLAIVTVVRNDLQGLRLTLESIEAQVRPPSEVFVIDGASTDGTTEWLLSANLPPYVSWVSEPDSGIYDAMNKGIQPIESQLLMFMNAGDRFASADSTREILEAHEREGWTWAFGDSSLISASGVLVGIHRLKYLRRIRFTAGLGTVPHQATVVSTELAKRLEGFRLDSGISADQEFLLRCWLQSNPSYLDTIIAVCDADGISSRQAPGAFARQMQEHRSTNGRPFGFRASDKVVTFAAVLFDQLKLGLKKALASSN